MISDGGVKYVVGTVDHFSLYTAIVDSLYNVENPGYPNMLPDLSIYSIERSRSTALSGQEVEIRAVIRNTGRTHAQNVGVAFYDGDVFIGMEYLGQVDASYFPSTFDYVALGHLHKPQTVADLDHIRYAGSPVALSFSEAGNPKVVVIVEFDDQTAEMTIGQKAVPEFQELQCIRGNLDEILAAFESMDSPENSATIWVEVQLDSEQWAPDLINRINEAVADRPIEVLAVRYLRGMRTRRLTRTRDLQTLEQLTPQEVFEKRMSEENSVDPAESDELKQAYAEIIDRVLSGAGGDAQ